ncbi:MAG: hypothetical protein WCQ89_15360 [Verrucomicrobiota bacterium]
MKPIRLLVALGLFPFAAAAVLPTIDDAALSQLANSYQQGIRDWSFSLRGRRTPCFDDPIPLGFSSSFSSAATLPP